MRLVTARRLTRLLQEDEARKAGPWYRFRRRLRRRIKKLRPKMVSARSACARGAKRLAAAFAAAFAWLRLHFGTAAVRLQSGIKCLFARVRAWMAKRFGELRTGLGPACRRLEKKLHVRFKRLKKRLRRFKNRYFGTNGTAQRALPTEQRGNVPAKAAAGNAARSGKPGLQSRPQASVTLKQKVSRFMDYALSEKHLRSTVAMGLLAAALLIFLGWSTLSDSGRMTYARLGVGSARGYILLGDECMENGNYSRAVENYYASISKRAGYEAAIKLAVAYSYTGDVSREVSALLYCAETYPQYKAPFEQLLALYPDESTRPPRVQAALEKGMERYGLQ